MGEVDGNDAARLAGRLIACRSICPEDDGAQAVLQDRLVRAGFEVLSICREGIHSLLAVYGERGPLFAFSGHSDVVPPGNESSWSSPPFQPTIREGMLHGRGAVDMKGPLAASVVAAERFAQRYPAPELPFRVGFLIAGDEEVLANHGTKDLLAVLKERGDRVAYCVVTESTSQDVLGDMVKVGRRGSLVGKLTVRGLQGHSAYPHLARNPISLALQPLGELVNQAWGEGYEGFPETTLQVTNIQAGTGAANVIPGEMTAIFNFRFSPEFTAEALQQRVEARFRVYDWDWTIDWSCDAHPFMTPAGRLREIAAGAIRSETGLETRFSTTGGTSDARFIAPTGAEVIELGALSRMCHQVDEHVSVEDLNRLSTIYFEILERFLRHQEDGE